MAKKDAPSVAPGLTKAVAKAADKIESKSCYGLPYDIERRHKLVLQDLGDMKLFDKSGVDREQAGDFVPLAKIKDDGEFLAISQTAPYPIGCSNQDGGIYLVWDSLDDFVARLVDKKDKTPFDKLEKTLEHVAKLIEDDAYADALAILDPILAEAPKVRESGLNLDDDLARAHNLHGLALKGVKQLPMARTAFETAMDAGDEYAILNMLDMYEDAHDAKTLIDLALAMREKRYFDDYCRIWLARYLAVGYAVIGDLAKAEAELRKTVDDYAVSASEKLGGARESLEKYIAGGGPGAAAIKPFLDWYKPKTYDVTPEQAKANKKLWMSFSDGMRKSLLKEIDKEDEESPSDADIARCFDVDSVDVDEDDGKFDKLDVFLNFPRVTRLSFYGDPEDLELLRKLTKLETINVNNDLCKNFQYPSRADRDLLAAAENADRKGIEKALKAGASLSARDDYGANALFRVAGNHDVDLCAWLISKGADPWAGNHGESNAFGMFGDEDRPKLEAAAKKAGIRHPDEDPYREFSVERTDRGATFEADEGGQLYQGESLVGKWSATAKVKMESPKRDNKLYDLHRVGHGGFIASERLTEVLRGPNVEIYPVTIVDHAGKIRPEKYFLVHPVVIDCLIVDKCYPQWNHIDPESMSGVGAHVIDPEIVGIAQFFRVDRDNSHPAFVTRELAAKLGDFAGVGISYAKR